MGELGRAGRWAGSHQVTGTKQMWYKNCMRQCWRKKQKIITNAINFVGIMPDPDHIHAAVVGIMVGTEWSALEHCTHEQVHDGGGWCKDFEAVRTIAIRMIANPTPSKDYVGANVGWVVVWLNVNWSPAPARLQVSYFPCLWFKGLSDLDSSLSSY